MNKLKLVLLLLITIVSACSKPITRKVIVMGKGKIDIKDNLVTMNNGSGHIEKSVDIRGDQAETWTVTTPTGKTTINIPEEKGVYILNIKTDTLVGSLQLVGTDISVGRTISQEELKFKIDSLTKLTKGDNVEFAGRNFFILPQQLIKISANIDAKIFGPFTLIPGSMDMDKNGQAPEIYKFYTNTEMRRLINNFKEMTY